MPRAPRACVLLDGGMITVVTGGRSPSEYRSRPSAAAQAPVSPEAGAAVAEEILSAISQTRPRSIAIGLNASWLDHAVVAMPPLGRLDGLAFIARDVTRRTTLPENDLLFATTSDAVRRRVSPTSAISQLVVSTTESSVEALVRGLARAGLKVDYVGSSSATYVSTMIRRHGKGDAACDEPTIWFELRESGFAIAVSTGCEIHQFRIVSVSLPEDVATLAQVVAEEVRRSTISFREKHRGRDVTRIRLLGRVQGDPEELRSRVAESTGNATDFADDMGPEADVLGEAAALLEARDHRHLDLLPADRFAGRRSWISIAPAAAVVAICCAGLIDISDRLDDDRELASVAPIGFVSPELAASTIDERGDFLRRLDAFESARDALRVLSRNRIDIPFFLGAIGSVLDPRCQLTAASFSSPVDGSRVIRIEGRFVDSYWEFESRLATLSSELSKRTGLPFVSPPDERPTRGEEFQEFVLVSRLEAGDEPADP